MAINYVKFQRGSKSAYDRLKELNILDPNTLYFIYANEDASVGTLYMGEKLISSGNTVIQPTAINLQDLKDVIVENAETNSFLIKDENGNWIAKTIEDVVELIQEYSQEVNGKSNQIFQILLNENEDDESAILRVTKDEILFTGDIAIIQKLIINDKYEYTAYIYTKDNIWTALDGNYNATNIYFDKNLIITADIGVQEIESNGFKQLDTAGKNLKQVLDMILTKRELPTYANPTIKVSSNEMIPYEVGSNVIVSYNTIFNSGTYSYGPETEITIENLNVEFNGENLNTSFGEFKEFIVEDNTKLRITTNATHSIGQIPFDNLGVLVNNLDELNQCQIQPNTVIGYSNYLTGFRNIFYGSSNSNIELISNNLRLLNKIPSFENNCTIPIVENARNVIIAIPQNKKIVKIIDNKAFGTDIFSKFNLFTVSIGGADATENDIGMYPIDYDVYVYSPSTALGANSYTVVLTDE